LNMHGSQDYQFVSINREEHATIEAYLAEHGIKMLSELGEAAAVSYKGMDVDSDDGGAARVQALGLSDEESSEDEDYVAGSDVDVPEEYDEDYVSPNDDEEDG
ncbi:FACT complex subunit, partial [Coemansia helicoidea]